MSCFGGRKVDAGSWFAIAIAAAFAVSLLDDKKRKQNKRKENENKEEK